MHSQEIFIINKTQIRAGRVGYGDWEFQEAKGQSQKRRPAAHSSLCTLFSFLLHQFVVEAGDEGTVPYHPNI